jgi:hypothetical protein
MNDQWNEKLECPVWQSYQESDQTTPAVLALPRGFVVVMDQGGPDFQCVDCGVFAKR